MILSASTGGVQNRRCTGQEKRIGVERLKRLTGFPLQRFIFSTVLTPLQRRGATLPAALHRERGVRMWSAPAEQSVDGAIEPGRGEKPSVHGSGKENRC